MKKIVIVSLMFLVAHNFFAGNSSKNEKIPGWFERSDVLYPDELYIKAQGEGKTLEEAEMDCISKISLYFDTTADVVSELSMLYRGDDGKEFSFQSTSKIEEFARISSQAEFLGVQFAKSFSMRGTHYAFAYIERASAFSVYESRIKINANALEVLLPSAENQDNPIHGIEAASRGVHIADFVDRQIKMAFAVKKVSAEYFLIEQELCKRIRAAFEMCRTNLVFRIDVQNDFDGCIKHAVSQLLEAEGYTVSEKNGVCQIAVEISLNERNRPAGTFFYAGVEISVFAGSGEKVFSYSRTVSKTGAPNGKEEVAKMLAYQKIQKEIEESLMQEFKKKIMNV